MDHITGDITSEFINKLSSGKEWYTTKELLAAGLPVFIVERIRQELEQNLAQSLLPPETIWADLESSTSKEAWDRYIIAIQNEVIVPASYVAEMVEDAVAFNLKLAVQPRKAVLEILFRDDTIVDQTTIEERSSVILVNGHLANALGRYLQKKEKKEITKEHAGEVIKKIDDKLVEGYHPLNWKDLLAPIFAISGGSASPELIAEFFTDKGKPGIAEAFRKLDNNISNSEFVEIVSSADVLEIRDDLEELSESPEQHEEESISDNEEKIAGEKTDMESDESLITGTDEAKIAVEEPEDKNRFKTENTPEDKEMGLNDLFSIGEEEKEEYQEDETDIEFDTSFDFTLEEAEDEEEVGTFPKKFIKEESDEEIENINLRYDQELDEEKVDTDPEETPETGNEVWHDVEEEVISEEDEGDGEETLLSRFVFDDPEMKGEFSEPAKEKKPRTIYDELNLIREDKKPGTIKSLFDDLEEEESQPFATDKTDDEDAVKKYTEPEPVAEQSTELPEVEQEGILEEDSDELKSAETHSDVPMWKSFLDRGDVVHDDTPFALDDSEDDEDLLDEDGFIETPIYDFTEDDEPFKEAFGNLSNWLADERERFIDEIFGGSETAYDIALAEIINYDNWKHASRFLEREIFSRNRIDLYSEVAVDFTDRLHTYFLEYKS
ncbi:MAG: hypothetical protein EA359_09645 [Balneolaceae bacterium]|nr:MAG: hypothetical protein EA359_09645 [Balneolaceae bacterium]